MKIGQVIHDHYQIVAKLGYGTSSTVWLARDLRSQKYWTLRVHVNDLPDHNQELQVYQHLAGANVTTDGRDEHPGLKHIRKLEDSFKIRGPHSEHEVFVMTPLGMSLRTFQEMQRDKVFPKVFVTSALKQTLFGIHFLHEANVIHTGKSADLMMSDSVLAKVEQNEVERPSPRKQTDEVTIQVSQYVLGGAGPLTICDLGQARIGDEHFGNAMPLPYRAPEVILDMPWGYRVDNWSVGLLAWDLLERGNLFTVYDHESKEKNDAHHLAAMTALLGPPPAEFLKRSEEADKYWEDDGQWKGLVPLPDISFERLAGTLQGEDKEVFIDFVQGFLAWLPEERLDILQGCMHSWLRGEAQAPSDQQFSESHWKHTKHTQYRGSPTIRTINQAPPHQRSILIAIISPFYGPASPYLDAEHDDRDPLLPNSHEDAEESPYLNGISIRRFWCIFSMILTLNFIACFDGTIMASSHPVITSYFNASNSASWLSTAFLLTSTSFQPLLGRISDSVGRKPPYLITMFIFAMANVWCATATSMTSFIFARAACGLGAGGMMTLGSIIISDMVTIEARGEYQSYLNITYGIGSALGAALGGAMADHLGWRWEFGIQVLPILICVLVAFLTVPNDLGIVGKRETFLEALQAFDSRGSLLLTTSITSLVLGLNLGGNVLPWSHPFVIAALVTFSVAFPTFLYSQSLATRPIMPLHLVRHSPRMNLIFANSLASILTNAILFNIPLYFQAVLLLSATDSGLRLVIPSVVSSTAGAITGLLITRTRRLKWPLAAGTTFFVLGTLALAGLQRGWPPLGYLFILVPHALGQGFQFPGTFVAVLAVSEQRDQAVVTSTLILWRSLGMVLGIATSSLVMQNALVVYLDRHVAGPAKADIIARVRESVETVARLEGPAREQVVLSYEAALRLTFLCCVGVAFVSWCLIMPVKLPRLGQRK
ncbi:putative transporter like protein [Verticillium longisporum]|uniref:Putative transporter like protein n=1 Tax=Verticillium longisporum TaxID=100787 RepID=A0A8I3ARK4_VERLO|nr:putative transporter like protein [Verticillium longisporum]